MPPVRALMLENLAPLPIRDLHIELIAFTERNGRCFICIVGVNNFVAVPHSSPLLADPPFLSVYSLFDII